MMKASNMVSEAGFEPAAVRPYEGRALTGLSYSDKMVGVAGIEPAHAGVKGPRLSTWLHPFELAEPRGFEPLFTA